MVELKKLAQKKDTNQLLVAKRWDKLREWRMLQADIEEKLKNPENFDTGLTLEIGPQLLHTLRHRSILQCMNHSTSKFGDVFTTHYNKGAIQRISVWLLESTSRDSVCEQQWFDTPYELKCLTYIAKRRVYVGFSTDLYLRLFTDGNSNFTELSHFLFMDTVLCLVYNREEEEIYAGGVGIIEEWKIIGAEHAATLVPGKKFITTDISRNDWIRDVKLDRVNNQMFAVHGNGILVFNFRTRKQTHRIPNRHEGPLKCCCYFPQYDYLITGGGDGKIRIFNATSFHLLHIIIGHYGPVTSVVPHQKDNLLFSCSYDGTVRLWRMDSLRVFTRLEVGEKIYSLSLLGDSEFFFQTEKNIMIYTQNEFYQFFTSIESESYKLICCRGRGKHNRIIVSAEDGSIRVFSPVTGLSLTIMYPMPTFQIFTQFAYDLHQNRLYTVVQGGKVLSYNTATNPAQCVEMLEPSEIDEEVTNLLLVTVEFMCDKVADADNLLFAGLNNGQIILCEALVCTLTSPVQAHEGALTCFEACTPAAEGGSQVTPSANILVTGGKDCYVKVWLMSVSCKTMHPLVEFSILIKIYLPCVPLYLCMYSQLLAVCVKTNTSVGVRWRLVIYLLSCRKDKWKTIMERSTGTSKMVYSSWITLLQIAHPPDEDHVFELTALDKCPVMNFFLTAGKDGFVKIWNSENKLLRELNFATPIYASCFANDRGDILVGFGTHVCSVSVINYLPLEELVKLHQSSVLIHIKDDGREFPVQFDHEAEPWIDLEKIKLYPVSLQERRKLKLEEEILEKLKRINEKEQTAKFVIFNDGDTTRVIRKDFADRLLTWARGKTKAKLGLIAAAPSPVDQVLKAKDSPVKTIQTHRETGSKAKVDESSEEETVIAERKYLDSEKLIEIYPPTVGQALQYLEFQKSLGPTEMRLLEEKKLLERDPIIAPDGYIPNSVIRQKLKPPEPPVVKIERRWKLKPVPKPEEKHMPLGFEFVTRWKEKTPPPRLVVLKWEDTPTPEASDRSMASSMSSVSLKSSPPTPPKMLKRFIRECHAKPKQESKSAKSSHVDESKSRELTQASTVTLTPFVENKAPGDEKRLRKESTGISERVLRLTPSPKQSEEGSPTTVSPELVSKPQSPTYKMRDSKGFDNLKAEIVQMRIKAELDKMKATAKGEEEETEKSKGKKRKSFYEVDIVQSLLAENWMPAVNSSIEEYEDVVRKLITQLDDTNPVVYGSCIDYLAALFKRLGMADELIDIIIAKLSENLDSVNTAIKMFTLKGLQEMGTGRQNVLKMVLRKLIDEEDIIRKAAADALLILSGVKNKEELLNLFEQLGLVTRELYNSKEDEEFAFKVLAERFAERTEDPTYVDKLQERILDWVERTTPGLISRDMTPDLEQLWKEGTRSGKSSMYKSREQSFMSEKSAVGTSGMTMYADLPATPGFSSELSELCLSRGVSKSGEPRSAATSRYNARMGLMDLMDRSGAINVPGERWEPPTPVTCSESSEHDTNPSVEEPLLQLQKEKSNLTNFTNESHGSRQSFDNVKVNAERTLTNLSHVGPLPSFVPRGNSDGKSYDAISMDSAIESGISISEYEGLSHYSEMLTFSHTDQQSFKDSVLSETNEVFDVEHDLEAEADDIEGADDMLQIEADENGDGVEGDISGLYFDLDLGRFVEVVEEVIVTPVPGFEGLEKLLEQEEEDEVSSKELSGKDVVAGSRPESKRDSRRERRGLSRETDSRKTDYRSTIQSRQREGIQSRQRQVDDRSVVSERSTSSRGSKASDSKTPEHKEEKETDRGSSVMVIITPRGEIVKSMVSVDGNIISPRKPIPDSVVEETPSKVAPENLVKVAPIHPEKVAPVNRGKVAQVNLKEKPVALVEPQEKSPCDTPPLKLSTFVDKGTHVTERCFVKRRSPKQMPPRLISVSDYPEEPMIIRFPSKRFFVIERKPLTADGKEGQLAGEEAGLQIMEHLSEQDSGISRDIADRGKGYPYGTSLTPVKSEESRTMEKLLLTKSQEKNWRKFLELPTAVERHKIELIKHEMAQGKLKQTSFPPITYFDRDLPMLPAEAGTRLLQTVRVGEKVPTSGVGRHRVEPVPGKLAVHTKNESEGRSCFGIIQMEWTTGVPTVKDPTYPPQLIPRKRPVLDDYDDYLPPLTSRYTGSQLSHLDRIRQGTSEAELHLPDLFTASTTPTVPHRLSPSYEWELPLPPPPAKESRTIIPYIKKEHDTYCKYYQMVKKKLHLYTSKQRERSMSLPTVVARSMGTENQTIDGSQHRQSRDYRLPATSQSRDPKLLLGPGQTLPPLKLGQLINI